MSDREKYIKIISDHFSIWEVRLQNLSSLNLYDANSFSEYSIAELLNLIFGYKLENLNKLKMNFPAIDLGDKMNSLCVQVTSTKSGKKIQLTIDKFLQNKLDKEYSELFIVILGKKQKSYSSFKNLDTFQFDADNQILDFRNLLSIIQSKPIATLEKISKILQSENSTEQKIKANPNEKRIKKNLAIKKRLQNAFLRKLDKDEWEYSWYEPWVGFLYSQVLIRSVDDKLWPNVDEGEEGRISSWFKGNFYKFYENGIELISHGGRAIFDKNGNWDLLEPFEDKRMNNSIYEVTNYSTFLRIPFDYIVDFDMDTDPYDALPSIYVKYEKNGMPYEKILYGIPGSHNLKRYQYIFDEDSRKKLE
ncbi:MAG: hypothetical protein E6Q46_08770 [Flavobacterium sp.]|nr:MAG: hypothetical protein E6Q46_08770 [Flavobacterium sp.]